MKKGIHPVWHKDATVTCACGNTFTVGSTKKSIRVDICANCHPFFTGKMKFVDTMGRVERFQQKQTEAKKHKSTLEAKKKKKEEKEKSLREQKSLKEMLMEMR